MNLHGDMNDYWNWILGGIDLIGLIALHAVGKKKAVGWLWAMFTQALWIVYSIATLQGGFLLAAVVKLALYTRNYVSWARSDKAEAKQKTHEERALAWADELIPDADELTRLKAASFLVKAIRCVELYPEKDGQTHDLHPQLPPGRLPRQ